MIVVVYSPISQIITNQILDKGRFRLKHFAKTPQPKRCVRDKIRVKNMTFLELFSRTWF